MCDFETLRARIVPIPKQMDLTQGGALKVYNFSKFCLEIPTAEFGPFVGAREKITKFLTTNCGADCFSEDGIKITVTEGARPEEVKDIPGGYRLTVTEQGAEIVGFDPVGCLYGIVTLTQLMRFDSDCAEIPALTILDWPENNLRGIKEECRYGSNVMEEQDWLGLVDELVDKKFNFLMVALYGCWCVQYDGRVSEYLYMPVKGHPELRTPMMVKYFSPKENRWIEYEKLPALFEGDLLDRLVRKCRDNGIRFSPSWNSLGHNTLLPAKIHECSAKEEDGVTATMAGFCTSNPKTYDLLFSIYDQIIDDYMTPYGMDVFTILLDEVHDDVGYHASNPLEVRSPWCKCPDCKDQDKGDIFIKHAVKVCTHLKKKGMKSVIMACDMLLPNRRKSLGWLGDRLLAAIDEADLRDVMLMDWWAYFDHVEKMYFDNVHPELGLRSVSVPWNGYYNWCVLYHPLRCIQLNAQMNHRDGGEGVFLYSMWEKCYDRMHDCGADYVWSYEQTGTVEDVTDRYVLRHFASRYEEARHAYRLMDWITEERKDDFTNHITACVSHFNLLLYKLSYYTYSYVKENKPYPRNFPGEPINVLLGHRRDYERALYAISSMAKEAAAIFQSLALDPSCDRAMADRMAYECENYICLVEDYLAMLKMYDLTQGGDQKKIAPLARARQQARLALMAHLETAKEKWVVEALAMRNHTIFMQMFTDIANTVESSDDPKIDMMDASTFASDRFFYLR